MSDLSTFALTGSRDPLNGEMHFPQRTLSTDGALRALDEVRLSQTGVLYSFAVVGDTTYGLIDLPGGVRLQAELAPGDAVIGSTYRLAGDADGWRFQSA